MGGHRDRGRALVMPTRTGLDFTADHLVHAMNGKLICVTDLASNLLNLGHHHCSSRPSQSWRCGAGMTTAEQIVVGVLSLIALIGWLRWLGVAGSRDGEMRNQHPTRPPKYQRPLNGRSSKIRTDDI
jgi:hypothetical protein